MEQQHATSTDKKMWGILIIAILALVVGAAGLIISLTRSDEVSPGSYNSGPTQLPSSQRGTPQQLPSQNLQPGAPQTFTGNENGSAQPQVD
jgi:hypothetical protein